jgi:hypothetical protein
VPDDEVGRIETLFAAMHESSCGTKLPIWNVRALVAIADIAGLTGRRDRREQLVDVGL